MMEIYKTENITEELRDDVISHKRYKILSE